MLRALIVTAVGGLFLLAAAYLLGGRYETDVAPVGVVFRTDRLTGEIIGCSAERCRKLPTNAATATGDSGDWSDLGAKQEGPPQPERPATAVK